jgi:Fe2+ or Zn2+ uptake regulation protein
VLRVGAAYLCRWPGSSYDHRDGPTRPPDLELRQRSLDKLTDDQRLVYDVLLESGPSMPKDLYDRYARRADEPKMKRTVRTYLQKLEQYGLVECEGAAPSRRCAARRSRR